ncbi:hypothetical protein PFUGPA_00003 [Plasmodium falciparum Palo Alto/Uganda]|uniref:Rifin n=1 Tax=Plasmodium falciparum (isolate Palo Alto / Uganda) TaxID=57270 RepID=W4J7I5_PLAFP|nr:hypothetical protein PFUGPA_00003 [Plasmodium falciparum Palo Alto/Uganda]
MWKTTEIAAAMELAKQAGAAKGAAAGLKAGVDAVITGLKELGVKDFCPDLLQSIGSKIHYTNAEQIANSILRKFNATCYLSNDITTDGMCLKINLTFGMRTFQGGHLKYGPPAKESVPKMINNLVGKATEAANIKAAKVAAAEKLAIETAEKSAIEAARTSIALLSTVDAS